MSGEEVEKHDGTWRCDQITSAVAVVKIERNNLEIRLKIVQLDIYYVGRGAMLPCCI